MTDGPATHWSHRLPPTWRPFAELARWDRPIGYWLLALPGWVGIAFALPYVDASLKWFWLAMLILVGAIAMRGAGCTYNDIVDRELDAQVARTRTRPLPSGRVSVRGACVWLLAQCAVGLAVLLLLPNRESQIVALLSIPLVAAYPFMKRITGFPQVWLGLTFNWAVLVAYAAMLGWPGLGVLLLYAGLACWTVGYDTIYALQDIEDDTLAGIKSTARSFGSKVRVGVGTAYLVAVVAILTSLYFHAWNWFARMFLGNDLHDAHYLVFRLDGAVAIIPLALHLLWQVVRLRTDDPALALRLFKSNGVAGALLVLGFLLPALASGVLSRF